MYKKNKPAIIFLLKFVVVYAVLSSMYSYYLDSFTTEGVSQADSFTEEVAIESSELVKMLGFESHLQDHPDEASVKFYLDDVYRIKIVEGCNGLSVMILFLSFIVAFGGSLLAKMIFVPLGILLIHISNIVRIAFLAYVYVYHYDYAQMTHDYIFPTIIYGMVFLLWVIWVNYFAVSKKKEELE
ncbi:MAG: exosortase family protein XrtF [Flavobacteriales bacterium]|nr:exosortase family protein XrtF [Flavobacteriales bacterium]